MATYCADFGAKFGPAATAKAITSVTSRVDIFQAATRPISMSNEMPASQSGRKLSGYAESLSWIEFNARTAGRSL